MLARLAWVTLLALWISTFQWMGDLEKRQRLTQDVVNIQSQNQKMMVELLRRQS
jgi:hypothetical protein